MKKYCNITINYLWCIYILVGVSFSLILHSYRIVLVLKYYQTSLWELSLFIDLCRQPLVPKINCSYNICTIYSVIIINSNWIKQLYTENSFITLKTLVVWISQTKSRDFNCIYLYNIIIYNFMFIFSSLTSQSYCIKFIRLQ